MAATRKSSHRASAVALPRRRPAVPLPLLRFLPSGRSLLVGFGLIGLAVACYLGARDTSLFAARQIEVTGARPLVVDRVEEALASLEGKSLLTVDGSAIGRRLEGLPDVRLVTYDRAFPHTVRVTVSAERPVAILRRRTESWLVSERGRILRKLGEHPSSRLPRIWTASAAVPGDGALLPDEDALRPALVLGRALSADVGFFSLVREARAVDGELVLVLRSGTELRMGAAEDIPLQLAVARRILRLVTPGARYVDVSVPERPVALE